MQNSLRFSPKLARLNEPVCLALKAKSKDLRLNSSSGGAFSLIAEFVLNHGGVVFGATFDKHLKVRHIAVERLEDLGLLRHSKYVESFIGDSLTRAQNFLKSGRLVLFSGTQCQIHGLNAFLRKAYSNLITLEVICNSVPSAKVWEIYKQSLECEMGEKLTDFNFRGKDLGWENYCIKASTNSKQKVIANAHSPYLYNAWTTHIITRKSCGNCYSKGFVSGADFTLGDFWGIRSWHADFVDELGISCVLAHSQKALEILQNLSQNCEIQATNLGVIALGNPALLHSNGVHPQRDTILREFFRIYETSKSAKKAVDYLATFMTNASQTLTKTGFFRHYYLVYKNDPLRKIISNSLKKAKKWLLARLKKSKIHANSALNSKEKQ